MSVWARLAGAYARWRSLRPFVRLSTVLVPLAILAVVLTLTLSPRQSPGRTPTPAPTSASWIFSPPTVRSTGEPAALLDDERLLYAPGWGTLEVRRFLERRDGVLDSQRLWIGDMEMPVADVITGLSLHYGISPKVMLTLLEVQSGLIDDPNPSPEALDWAMGFRDEEARGLESQLDWAARELYRGMRDYPDADSLLLTDERSIPLPVGINMGSYAVMRIVAQTGDEALLQRFQRSGPNSFVQTYIRLFEEDPRLPWAEVPAPASQPFLTNPYEGDFEVTSIFDHQRPFLSYDGTLISYMGDDAFGLPYDGHNGWDYALDFETPVLAAADGLVAWAGNSDDNCATPARGVIVDHRNGYHTIYWHMDRVDVQPGQRVAQGEVLGLAGASGCAEGPHLHFGVHFLGRQVDPEGWCGSAKDPWAGHPAGMASAWLWADRFSPCQEVDGAIIVDDTDAGFQQAGTRWSKGQGGVGRTAQWVPSEPKSGVVPVGNPGTLDGVVEGGTWRPELPKWGEYRVYAFVPYWNNNTPDTQAAHYLIHHLKGEDIVVVDQSLHVNRWVYLGSYYFAAGRQGFVHLDNLTDEVGFCVWFDALMWVPQ